MQARAAQLEGEVAALVRDWPAPAERLEALAGQAGALAADLDGATAALAGAVAEALRQVATGAIDAPEVALTLASSAHALARALEPGAAVGEVALEAARYELETFFPAAGSRPPDEPDVPLSSLSRRDR